MKINIQNNSRIIGITKYENTDKEIKLVMEFTTEELFTTSKKLVEELLEDGNNWSLSNILRLCAELGERGNIKSSIN